MLDTNICVHLLKNEYDVNERIAREGVKSSFLSEISLAELLYGIENSAPDRRIQNIERFDYLQTLFAGRILSIGVALYEYARQKAAVRRIGRPVGEFDLLIGSTAIVHDLILVIRNTRDFENLDRIKMENWIDQ